MNPKVDSYIKGINQKWQLDVVTQLRQLIHKADPKIEEKIKWGTPAFDHSGSVAWIFCASAWVHFAFPQGALLDAKHGLFEEGKDTTSKGKRTIKLQEGQPMPNKIIVQLVRQAVSNNLAGNKIDFKIPKRGELSFDVPHEYKTILGEHGQLDAYLDRPYYQQKGWVQWIEQAKQPQTRQKRVKTMLKELREGSYMPPKNSKQ